MVYICLWEVPHRLEKDTNAQNYLPQPKIGGEYLALCLPQLALPCLLPLPLEWYLTPSFCTERGRKVGKGEGGGVNLNGMFSSKTPPETDTPTMAKHTPNIQQEHLPLCTRLHHLVGIGGGGRVWRERSKFQRSNEQAKKKKASSPGNFPPWDMFSHPRLQGLMGGGVGCLTKKKRKEVKSKKSKFACPAHVVADCL